MLPLCLFRFKVRLWCFFTKHANPSLLKNNSPTSLSVQSIQIIFCLVWGFFSLNHACHTRPLKWDSACGKNLEFLVTTIYSAKRTCKLSRIIPCPGECKSKLSSFALRVVFVHPCLVGFPLINSSIGTCRVITCLSFLIEFNHVRF